MSALLLVGPIVLAVVGITGIYIAGRKRWLGWALGLAAQVLWLVYALLTNQPGFILSALAYGLVYGMNVVRWRREAKLVPPSIHASVVHLAPKSSLGITPCCRVPIFELPRTDRMTNRPRSATCDGWTPAQRMARSAHNEG